MSTRHAVDRKRTGAALVGGNLRGRAAESATRPEAGSNLRNRLSQADWRFLLPTLDPGRVLVLGEPTEGMLAGLEALSVQVEVVGSRIPPRGGPYGLIVVRDVDGASASRLGRGPLAELARLLAPGGTLYLETRGLRGALALGRVLGRVLGRARGRDRGHEAGPSGDLGLEVAGWFWLVLRKGQIWSALPLGGSGETRRYFFDHVLHGTSRKGRLLAAVGSRRTGLRLLTWVLPGRALVLRRPSAPGSTATLGGLATLAGSAGLSVDSQRTGVFARGAYDSNKVTFFLFEGNRPEPAAVVKTTRSSAWNARLEAEHRALSLVEERNLAEPGSYPRALFLAYRQGLAVLGESALAGSPFRSRTTGRVDCPFAAASLAWLVALGARSAVPAARAGEGIADRFERLVRRLDATYRLTGHERDFLLDRMRALRGRAAGMPLVFRHGDAGTWNVLVTTGDRIAFLDWEASEPQGPPLWDLFDFMRSFALWLARVRGERDGVATYERAFLREGSLSDMQTAAVERYRRAVGLDRGLIEPLFYACWMQRALREAEWAEGSLDDAGYINLIRLCVRQRRARGLEGLFR